MKIEPGKLAMRQVLVRYIIMIYYTWYIPW